MKVLVTGAGGFIGSHLVEYLLHKGDDVTALVRYRGDGSRGWLEESVFAAGRLPTILAGDVCDVKPLAYDVVYNLAAEISIPYSYQNPEAFVRTNVGGILHLLQEARLSGCRIVQMSTSETYGTAQSIPMSEAHPTSCQSPYAASKAAADQLCLAFSRAFGVSVVIARPFNVYGPRQSQRSVIPNVMRQLMLTPQRPVLVGTVNATRDFTYVEDTVTALWVLAQQDEIGPFNVGSGTEITIGALVERIADLLGVGGVTVRVDGSYQRPERSEVNRLLCDASKMRALGWAPRVSFDSGLIFAAKWLEPRLHQVREGLVV